MATGWEVIKGWEAEREKTHLETSLRTTFTHRNYAEIDFFFFLVSRTENCAQIQIY